MTEANDSGSYELGVRFTTSANGLVTGPKPVAVGAGQTHIASYTAPNGRYAADTGYFQRTALTSPPLAAPATGPGTPNGVYKVGPGFPASTYQGGNCWVDAVVTP